MASKGPDHSGSPGTVQGWPTFRTNRNSAGHLKTYSTTQTLLHPWKRGNTTHQWQLGGTTHPIHQQTSMQSIPWPPSCSLTSTTSIHDPSWARPTQQLQGWPCQHLPKTQWPGNHSDTPKDVQTPPACNPSTPGTSRPPETAKSKENCHSQYSTKPECQVGRESTLDHLADHQLTTTVLPPSGQNWPEDDWYSFRWQGGNQHWITNRSPTDSPYPNL